MKLGKERREAKRISYICEVECEGAGISRLATRITDLSTTGAFIDSLVNYAPGTPLTLRFRVKDLVVETQCEVRYSLRQMGMGVRFVNLPHQAQAVLEHLVEGKPLAELPSAAAPPAVGPKPASATPAQYMLTGNFAIVSLFDVIQIIENNRLAGALVVQSAVAEGEIYFDEGRITGAQTAESVGQDALVKFLDVAEGGFTFNKSETVYPRTIQASSNTGLMLDLLRVKDEEAAFFSLSD